jgi:hypothetical protein
MSATRHCDCRAPPGQVICAIASFKPIGPWRLRDTAALPLRRDGEARAKDTSGREPKTPSFYAEFICTDCSSPAGIVCKPPTP